MDGNLGTNGREEASACAQSQTNSMQTGGNGDCLGLDDLPDDMILVVARLLTPREIASGLLMANRRFARLFSEVKYWKRRIKEHSSKEYPIIPDQSDVAVDWRERCYQREQQDKYFGNSAENMIKWRLNADNGGLHYADISTMTFSKDGRHLFTGARDRQVLMWDVEQMKGKAHTAGFALSPSEFPVHGGWVSSLALVDSQLSSGGWDNLIGISDISRPSSHASDRLMTLKCNHPVISHVWEPGRMVAGLMFGTIVIFDPRTGREPLFSHSANDNEALLSCQVVKDQAIFVGSNKKLVVFDLRKMQLILKTNLFEDDFGCKVHASENHIWIGSKHGQVRLYNMNFELVEDFTEQFGHSRLGHVTGIHADAGHVMTCALDNKARMFEPTKNARLMFEAKGEEPGFTAMAYSENCTLALASGITMDFWWPKPQLET